MKVTLTLSQEEAQSLLPLNTANCVPILTRLKIAGTVTDTLSSVDDDCGAFAPEKGVVMDLYGVTKADVCERLWPVVRDVFALECLHVHELGRGFNGCIYDWMRPSCCPMTVRKRARETAAELAQGQSVEVTAPATLCPSDLV